MALIKLGAIVTRISGKLGDNVFSRNRGGAYVRVNATPSNPQTSFQQAVRAIMTTVTQTWSTLTDDQRGSWNNATGRFKKANKFGDIRELSGKALFQGLNQNLGIIGLPLLVSAPPNRPIPNAMFWIADGDVSNSTFNLQLAGDTTGSRILIYGTPPMTQGTTFVKDKLRIIRSDVGLGPTTLNIFASYSLRFQQIQPGDNIRIGIIIINASGQASPITVIKATIVA